MYILPARAFAQPQHAFSNQSPFLADKRIKVYPAVPSSVKACREPVKAANDSQIALLDPTGSRTRLFARDNAESVQVGDIILVRQKEGDPFSGVVMSIKRRAVDTAVLLRANLTRVGVEVWFKIYSPNVTGIELVQRSPKRKRRARLYYLR
jgi:large subunit ribosomal protein L19